MATKAAARVSSRYRHVKPMHPKTLGIFTIALLTLVVASPLAQAKQYQGYYVCIGNATYHPNGDLATCAGLTVWHLGGHTTVICGPNATYTFPTAPGDPGACVRDRWPLDAVESPRCAFVQSADEGGILGTGEGSVSCDAAGRGVGGQIPLAAPSSVNGQSLATLAGGGCAIDANGGVGCEIGGATGQDDGEPTCQGTDAQTPDLGVGPTASGGTSLCQSGSLASGNLRHTYVGKVSLVR